jgi:predicted small secreted protein
MRKTTTHTILMVAASALVAGCSTLSPKDLSRAGTTYELTQPACHAEFSDGTSQLFFGKCITVVRSGAFKKVELPAGTCLKLGEPQVLYLELNREVVYDVEVAGAHSTISKLDSPRSPRIGMVSGTCTPVKAPPALLSLQ